MSNNNPHILFHSLRFMQIRSRAFRFLALAILCYHTVLSRRLQDWITAVPPPLCHHLVLTLNYSRIFSRTESSLFVLQKYSLHQWKSPRKYTVTTFSIHQIFSISVHSVVFLKFRFKISIRTSRPQSNSALFGHACLT